MATAESDLDIALPERTLDELKGKDRDFAKVLRRRVGESILPGETPLSGTRLDEVTVFLLAAAEQRTVDEPSLLIRSAHGQRRFMRIAVINTDMPFLVDSVAAAVAAHGLSIDLIVHPIVPVRRDPKGMLTELPEGEETGEKRESMIYLETARVDAKQRRALEADLVTAIADTCAANVDWPRLKERIEADADRISDAEGAALLRWLGSGMMTHLGHLTIDRDGKITQTLGVCRKSARDLAAEATYAAAFAWFEGKPGKGGGTAVPGRAPLIIKANRLSRVHRCVPFDLFLVPICEGGRPAALSVHAGIWTSAALTTSPTQVPVLRRQLATITERLDFDPKRPRPQGADPCADRPSARPHHQLLRR